jgi:hypothetical protein
MSLQINFVAKENIPLFPGTGHILEVEYKRA